MPFDYQAAIRLRKHLPAIHYSHRDVSLYALSLGFGSDPLDEFALDHILEARGPHVLPTVATALVRSLSSDLGLHMPGVLHAAQKLRVHRPLPPTGTLEVEALVDGIIDKGPGKGAIVSFSSTARLAGEEAAVFTMTNILFARGDGGCGGPGGPSAKRETVPDRPADQIQPLTTLPEQALWFRLNGDLNLLHADPVRAKQAGFPRPILHGLATYGIAARAIVTALGIAGDRLQSFNARFTGAVYPGETLITEIWDEADHIAFRCRVAERDIIVLDDGRCTVFGLRPAFSHQRRLQGPCAPDRGADARPSALRRG